MAFTPNQQYRRRKRRPVWPTYIALVGLFLMWSTLIFYALYGIPEDKLKNIGSDTIHDIFTAHTEHSRERIAAVDQLDSHITPETTKRGQLVFSARKESGREDIIKDTHLKRTDGSLVHKKIQRIKKIQTNFGVPNKKHVGPEIFTTAFANQNDQRADNTAAQRLMRNESSYTEVDWRLFKEPETNRMTIIPGGRWDPPRLGEQGRSVNINPDTLNQGERSQYQQGWDKHSFNEFASKLISVQREVPDYRTPQCRQEFKDIDSQALSQVSIIICFYNEAWSVLQRTVYSVLLRSPSHLIEEIILVDDFSDLDDLKGSLERFVSKTDKVRLLRMSGRAGLVKARLAGVDAAQGPILIFLDSHVECQEGWLEPLLQTIQENPTVAVTPQIDITSDKTFSINKANTNIGILEFESFGFNWSPVLPRIRNTIKSDTAAIQSPTMAGGLFAIRKDFFLVLGTYDPHLALWGGENIELSLKLWLCGGGILTHPCSRVAHVFRDTSPYLTGKLVHVSTRNSARVAFVWADAYKRLYFKSKAFAPNEWQLIQEGIQERIDLRTRLDCKPFHWYLEHVYPELHIDGTGKFLGPIKSSTNGLCIQEDYNDQEGRLILVDCHNAIQWEMSRIKEIRFRNLCLTTSTMHRELFSTDCNFKGDSQALEYKIQEGTIYHPHSNRCLTAGPDDYVYTVPCMESSQHQKWHWPRNQGYIP